MAGKKGVIPKHITNKKFSHPRIDHPVIKTLDDIEDPRKPSLSFRYSLTSVLFMALSAVICGATDWAKVVVMCEGMIDWLALYVDVSKGVPCERTFINIFNVISSDTLESALRDLSSLIRENITHEVVNFDGQTKRGTADKAKGLSGIHILNAWSADNRICLGQLKVEDKSNEIPAMPKLMDSLDLKGTIITADAMNTQKATVAKTIEKEADYVLPVKENQKTLYEDIIQAFAGLDKEQAEAKKRYELEIENAKKNHDGNRLEKLLKKGIPTCGASSWEDEIEKSHGRIEIRRCTTILVGDLPSKDGWIGLKSIARVVRDRIEGDKRSSETIYYITSLKPNASLIAEVVREHWSVENCLHWRLDVVFRQDKSRYRNRVGANNLAVIYKIALNGLLREDTIKRGVATKQCAAACNPAYRDLVLKKLF